MVYFLLGVIVCLVCLLAVCLSVIARQKKKNENDYELRIAKEIIASGVDYYKKLDQMLQEIRILRHDYKYQINVIEELAKISNAKYIHEFLETTRDWYNQTEPVVYCANPVINALLVNYMERFAKNDIPFQAQAVLPAGIKSNYEICIILGNLLENSLEGTMTVLPQERRVSLNIALAGGQLLIEVQNTFDGKLAWDKQTKSRIALPLSRKGAEGGYGLKSILAVCKRHGGEYLPRQNNNEYTARVLLNV